MADKGKTGAIIGGLAAAGAALAFALTRRKPSILPEDIRVSDLIIEPAELYVGEQVSISVLVTNQGEVAGSYTVNCEVI